MINANFFFYQLTALIYIYIYIYIYIPPTFFKGVVYSTVREMLCVVYNIY